MQVLSPPLRSQDCHPDVGVGLQSGKVASDACEASPRGDLNPQWYAESLKAPSQSHLSQPRLPLRDTTVKTYSLSPQSQGDMALPEQPSMWDHLTQTLRTPCAFLEGNS